MKPIKDISSIIALFSLLLCGMNNSTAAADVDARLSTSEAWVGIPVVLQLSISNAADYEQPIMPEIDGCDIRSAGEPSQSTQTTIINGRRSDTRSVVMQFLITPRREGTYEIPPIAMKVDGRSVTTQKLRFVATKSQTGNLLFVEIEGGKDKVFVGQPLELKLKIWIKPFQDQERKLTLSEENMWQMISEQTSWGSFLDRMKELAANNQRPGGKEVLRDDGQGNERSYYLYEITATVYPKRPGKIEADDVQIVVNYPTELGKARDPFGDFFGGSAFGGRSPLSQMMDDDFFSSPFSNRLTVSASRPVVAEAKVDTTEVLPVPSEGRPADYRGAVGRYNIVTQATPTAVKAGDPITLNIGIAGTGPMELVQAPPLFELPLLTADFKVADQSLAGFVQDNTKLFSTTIRPRREGITQIPAIPFSFFNPDTGKYETVMSDPISITVDKSESLSLDAIVGKQRHDDGQSAESGLVSKKMEPDFTNDNSASVLLSQSPATALGWWWMFVIVPPTVWIITVIVRHQSEISRFLPSFRSAKTRCLRAIGSADRSSKIVTALTRYIASRTKQTCSSSAVAVGALRTAGIAQAANDVEAFFLRSEESQFSGSSQQSLSESRHEAIALLTRIEAALDSVSKSQVRRSGRAAKNLAARTRDIGSTAQRVSMFIIAALVASSASAVTAAETSAVQSGTATAATAIMQAPDTITLSPVQQQTLLTEAGDLYSRATDVAKTDSAEANDLFTSSAAKYELLVDSGVHSARLYRNLGNACLQSNQLGRAIVSYEKARVLDPGDRQLAVNLEFANSLVKGQEAKSTSQQTSGDATSLASILQKLRMMNAVLIDVAGMSVIIWTLVISSLLFWSLLTARTLGYRFPVWRFAIVPLLLLTTSLTSTVLASTQPRDMENAVIVAGNITLHAGDGDSFESVLSLDAAQGHRVQILTTRGDWTQVKTRHGHVGWIPSRDVESTSI
ncbi:MAG TPA: BatD family protein [Planctomycetaceae bacterium]|nr:BatD family protein [Planctomycetaceae bacterium]